MQNIIAWQKISNGEILNNSESDVALMNSYVSD